MWRGAQAYVKAAISDLLMNRMDLSLLVITKARTLLAAAGWCSNLHLHCCSSCVQQALAVTQ